MALSKNREIFYENPVEYIEHRTGKKVLSWRREMYRFGSTIFFTDKTMIYISEGEQFDWEKVEYLRIPNSICMSCGQDAHASSWNWKEQCSETVKGFWNNVRKVYWHRYTKNK